MQIISDLFAEANGLVSVALEGSDVNVFGTDLPLSVPTSLRHAPEQRKKEFLLGRHCATLALKKLNPDWQISDINIRADRSPDWPQGIVGTITHCEGFTAAVVGKQKKFFGIGRDTEPVLTESTSAEIRKLVTLPGEVEKLAKLFSGDEFKALTLIYSAKESLYKCLAPHTGIFFDFSDATIEPIGESPNTYQIRLLKSLGEKISEGRVFSGDFVIRADLMHTRCTWRNNQP